MPGGSQTNLNESYGRSLALFTELSPSPLARFDRGGRIQLANRAAVDALGAGQLVGEQLGDLISGLSLQSIAELIETGGQRRIEWRSPTRNFVFELRGIPELGAGVLYGFDVTDLKGAESELARQRQRLLRHNAALLRLAHDGELFGGNLQTASELISRSAAETIGVSRAGIWLLRPDNSGIVLHDLYELEQQTHSNGVELEASDYIEYFAALHTERSIVANDARNHPATRGFRDSYLDPLGITSMLDVPVRRGAQTVGVLCCEHVGPQRTWAVDETNFAAGLAALFSQALEIAGRS